MGTWSWRELPKLGGKAILEWLIGSVVAKVGAAVLGMTAVGTLMAAIELHWDAWIWSASASIAFGVILLFWDRHIRGLSAKTSEATQSAVLALTEELKKLTTQAASSSQVANSPSKDVLVHGNIREESLDAVGIPRDPTIRYVRHPVPLFECECIVDFLGLGMVPVASPTSLVLTGKGGTPTICTLETKGIPSGYRQATYSGSASLEVVSAAMSETIGHLVNTYPPPRDAVCDVELHLPSGAAHKMHEETRTRMDFEVETPGKSRTFFIRVA